MMEKLKEFWLWSVAIFFTLAAFAAMVAWVGMIVLFLTGRMAE